MTLPLSSQLDVVAVSSGDRRLHRLHELQKEGEPMEPEYFSYVEQDPSLHELLAPALPALRTLTAEQVETLVFYLKSLHSYYPASANESENWLGFSERLRVIRESPQQTTLQRKASSKLLKGMATCVVAGVFLTLGIALLAAGLTLGGGALIAGAVGLFVLADARFGKQAIDTAKEQDRRYFLQSIRAARACNELDWAGLFSHNGVTRPGPQSDEDIEQSKLRVAELSAQLRSALYNDEYMAYSSCGARAT